MTCTPARTAPAATGPAGAARPRARAPLAPRPAGPWTGSPLRAMRSTSGTRAWCPPAAPEAEARVRAPEAPPAPAAAARTTRTWRRSLGHAPAVQAALHVRPTSSWSVCGAPIQYGRDVADERTTIYHRAAGAARRWCGGGGCRGGLARQLHCRSSQGWKVVMPVECSSSSPRRYSPAAACPLCLPACPLQAAGLAILIYNGEADACVPLTDNQWWTASMNYTLKPRWTAWVARCARPTMGPARGERALNNLPPSVRLQ